MTQTDPTVDARPKLFGGAPPVWSEDHVAAPTSAPLPSGARGWLATRDVSCWFSGRKVLERCSLSMQPGRVTALIGPSGCG